MTREEALYKVKGYLTDIIPAENYSEVEEIITALEQKPCEDCISRQDAIRWVKTECNPYGKPTLDFESGKKVIEHLGQMPSAEPKTGWIPVSERLPEDTTKPVLISGNHKGLGVYAVDIARYNGGMWQYDGFTFPDCDILAWMPVPEPYKGEGEEHETD